MNEEKQKIISKRKTYKEKRDAEIRKRIKDDRFAIRLPGDDKIRLKEIAKSYGMDLTTYVLAACFFNCIIFVNFEDIKELSYQVGKLGNNINQIARGINEAALKDNIDAELINDVKMQMDQLRGLEEALIETNKRFYRAAKKTVVEIKENFQEEI